MTDKIIDPRLAAELMSLALLPDEKINTSDVPEVSDWSRAVRGRFSVLTIEKRGYDVRAIANWVLDYLDGYWQPITNMSLNKLVYLIVERGLVEKTVLFSPARVEAWDHGPVFREIYHAIKGNTSSPVTKRISRYSVRDREVVEAREQFSHDDVCFFRSVIDDYKDFTASQLRGISHRTNGPWDTVWRSANPVNPGMVIHSILIMTTAPKQRDLNGRH
jgi:uncharacterized phage-associated protein